MLSYLAADCYHMGATLGVFSCGEIYLSAWATLRNSDAPPETMVTISVGFSERQCSPGTVKGDDVAHRRQHTNYSQIVYGWASVWIAARHGIWCGYRNAWECVAMLML